MSDFQPTNQSGNNDLMRAFSHDLYVSEEDRVEAILRSVNEEVGNYTKEINDLVNSRAILPEIAERNSKFKLILDTINKADEAGESSFESVDFLLSSVKEPLIFLSDNLGSHDFHYIHVSSLAVNKVLNILIRIVNKDQCYTNIKKARTYMDSLSSFSMSHFTCERYKISYERIKEFESIINSNWSNGYNASGKLRTSEKIKRFGHKIAYGVKAADGKRYTTGGLALISMPFLFVGLIVSLFERK